MEAGIVSLLVPGFFRELFGQVCVTKCSLDIWFLLQISIQWTVQSVECWSQDFKPVGASWCYKRQAMILSRSAGNEVRCKSIGYSLLLNSLA